MHTFMCTCLCTCTDGCNRESLPDCDAGLVASLPKPSNFVSEVTQNLRRVPSCRPLVSSGPIRCPAGRPCLPVGALDHLLSKQGKKESEARKNEHPQREQEENAESTLR